MTLGFDARGRPAVRRFCMFRRVLAESQRGATATGCALAGTVRDPARSDIPNIMAGAKKIDPSIMSRWFTPKRYGNM